VLTTSVVFALASWQRARHGASRLARRTAIASVLLVGLAGGVGFLQFDRSYEVYSNTFGGPQTTETFTKTCGRPFFDKRYIFYLAGGAGAATGGDGDVDGQPCATSSDRRRATILGLTMASAALSLIGLAFGLKPPVALAIRRLAIALAPALLVVGGWLWLFAFTAVEGYSCDSPVSSEHIREGPVVCEPEARDRLRLGRAGVGAGLLLLSASAIATYRHRRRAPDPEPD
jgi:hypothetical protein